MNEDILSIILKDTYTLANLKHRINVLKSYLLENLYGAEQKKEFEAKDLVWLKSLPSPFYQNFNKDNVSSLFSELEKKVTELKTLTLYLTFEADNSSLAEIGTYARKNFGNSLILDIKYDPHLIAGCALVWKGIYRDYSLRSKIEEKKSMILDSFKKYLR